MKTPCLLLAFLSIFRLSAQCPTTDLVFNYQLSVDSFSILYPGCKNFQGSIMISGSDITHLDSLYPLESVGGYLAVYFCDALEHVKGLEHLRSVGDALDFNSNQHLSSIAQLVSLQEAKSVYIGSCPELKSLDGLERIQAIPHILKISKNDSLKNLSALSHLQSVGFATTIERNAILTDLKGLDSLINFGSSLTIMLNPALSSLEGLDHAFTCSELYVTGNSKLLSLKALQQMSGLKALVISTNGSLESLEGLEHITQLSQGAKLSQNNMLKSLDALSNLRTIGDLYVSGNNALTSLKGLDSLNSMRSFDLEQTFLNDFTGLGGLKQITGQFLIDNNPMLNSFNGLDQLTSIQLDVFVVNNFSLSSCAIEAICKKFDIVPSQVYFDSNGPGCNSNPEVYNACLSTSTHTLPETDGPRLFPNPSTGWVQFQFQEGVAFSIQVINGWGQVVVTQRESAERVIDMSGQAPGLYWVIFQDGEKQWRQPLLISCGQ